MPLTCSCDWEPEPGDIVWEEPNDYTVLSTFRRKRCKSCNDLIGIGDTVIKFKRYKIPESDIECNIYGEDGEVPLAPGYHCERCADIFFSLQELKFCVYGGESMLELLEEYHQDYGTNN